MSIDDVPNTIDCVYIKDDQEDDPVVSEVPVYLNHIQDPPFLCGEIYVLLNSLRHHSRPYGDQGQLASVEIDDATSRLRMNYGVNTRSETYDTSSIHRLKQHSLIARPSARDSSSATHCVGVLSDGILNLVPVTALCNVRPCFEHIDSEVASRKTASTVSAETSEQATRPLTGKALHYQQLVKSIQTEKTNWRKLDHYDFDSVEAADLFQEHMLVQPGKLETAGSTLSEERRKLKELKCRELEFECDQEQYLYKLSSGHWSNTSTSGVAAEGSKKAPETLPLHELTRLDFSRQIETIMKRFQLIRFGDLLTALPANTKARYSEADVLAQLDQCAICIQGNWVVLSHLTSHRPQMWDTRDALLILLHAGREVTIQLLSSINGLPKEEIEEIVRNVCRLDILSNTWRLKLRPDESFTAQHPEVVKRHESVATSIINRLKTKKERSKVSSSPDSPASTFTRDELQAMAAGVRTKLTDAGASTTDEVRQALQTSTRDHFISEATALEILRLIEAVPVRDRWVVASRGTEVDTLRLALIALYRDRDALTKAEILAAFADSLGRPCELSDHDLRKLIKEFASNDKGYWVFNGEPIAERRYGVKSELDDVIM